MEDSNMRERSPALIAVELGLVGTALAFTQWPVLGPDNFVFAKVLVLCLASSCATILWFGRRRLVVAYAEDCLIAGAVVLALVSTLFATSTTYGLFALANVISPALVFWMCRSMSGRGYRVALMYAVGACCAAIAATALVEAFGGISFTPLAPGGAIGNRNRMAHLLAIATPVMMLLIAKSKSRVGVALLCILLMAMTVCMALSRSRVAWLSLVVMSVGATAILAISGRYRHVTFYKTVVILLIPVTLGVVTAATVPNRLNWNSNTPFRDTAVSALSLRDGTGAGRVVEYATTVRMIAEHPLLGVGPGNWRIMYSDFALSGDPNIGEGIMPMKRYPQSEWLGVAGERGIPSLLLYCTLGVLWVSRWVRILADATQSRHWGVSAAGLTVFLGVCAIGLADPLLQTPTAGFLVAVIFGATAPLPRLSRGRIRLDRRVVLPAVIAAGMFVSYSAVRQLTVGMLYGAQPTLASLRTATVLMPDDYTARILYAYGLMQAGLCSHAKEQTSIAESLHNPGTAQNAIVLGCSK